MPDRAGATYALFKKTSGESLGDRYNPVCFIRKIGGAAPR